MIQKKAFLIFAAAILFNFSLNNISFAIEDTGASPTYKDYQAEFIGKDTCESFNRKVFAFNLKFNKYIVRPVNIAWASVMPQHGMDMVENFYTNITFPVRLAGCLLQKDFKASKQETKRFFTNTTVGVVGLNDPAKTKYKLEPRKEDMEQVLAYYNVKKGPYLVLPIIGPGTLRDLAGEALDLPLNPTSYIMGPIALVSTGVSVVNGTTSMQPIFKMAENYPDPYYVSKRSNKTEKYMLNSNVDRKDVLDEEFKQSKNIVKVNNVSNNSGLKADIELKNYNSQGPLVDAMRTMFFDNQNLNDSKWAELSVWNKTFPKKLKISSVSVNPLRPKYKYRYVLQKDKTAPLAIIYPSIGEGIMSSESMVQAKILYDSGYSVLIQGSPFQWEFVESMPEGYKPGLPYQDATELRKVTSKIITNLEIKQSHRFDKKILVGTSFGALTGIFAASQEESDNTLGLSNYIFINPPIEIFYALKQLDKYSQAWKNDPSDLKLRFATTVQKVINVSDETFDKKVKEKKYLESQTLPFNNDEAQMAISFAMNQKLSDVVFTVENGKRLSIPEKNDLYETIDHMIFYEYAQKYLINNQPKPLDQLTYDSSLYSLSNFLQQNKKYKIYHSLDDCFVNTEQLIWLKKQTKDKSVLFSNGSHLGYLYRSEFIDKFKKDIKFQNSL